jgi:hypothetical protein
MTSGSILEPAEGIVKEKVVKRGEKLRAINILNCADGLKKRTRPRSAES